MIRICNCTFFHFYTTALALNATLWEERSCSKSQGAIFWYNIYIFANLYYIPYVFHHEIYFQITILIFALHSEIIFIFCCKKCIFEKHFVLYIPTIGILIGLWPFFKKKSVFKLELLVQITKTQWAKLGKSRYIKYILFS